MNWALLSYGAYGVAAEAADPGGVPDVARVRREHGKSGTFIGDGKPRYGPECIVETYYSAGLAKGIWLTLDYQRIANPAYNRDRGPVQIAAFRLHAQY